MFKLAFEISILERVRKLFTEYANLLVNASKESVMYRTFTTFTILLTIGLNPPRKM